ncbi:hypothetical protein FB561_2606 [Kribbella amoyensis]|uniref:Uncharacterized protein n=1 Tax=Kribbella amoyensis TaxID=996641 RepID=A0A561BRG8_9ACTN|nr:hypothetical protein [Kribbella amoyensis]TWD81490.1 hypothetical protein FB561_2606 [Kribbella amoyensis]
MSDHPASRSTADTRLSLSHIAAQNEAGRRAADEDTRARQAEEARR